MTVAARFALLCFYAALCVAEFLVKTAKERVEERLVDKPDEGGDDD